MLAGSPLLTNSGTWTSDPSMPEDRIRDGKGEGLAMMDNIDLFLFFMFGFFVDFYMIGWASACNAWLGLCVCLGLRLLFYVFIY